MSDGPTVSGLGGSSRLDELLRSMTKGSASENNTAFDAFTAVSHPSHRRADGDDTPTETDNRRLTRGARRARAQAEAGGAEEGAAAEATTTATPPSNVRPGSRISARTVEMDSTQRAQEGYSGVFAESKHAAPKPAAAPEGKTPAEDAKEVIGSKRPRSLGEEAWSHGRRGAARVVADDDDASASKPPPVPLEAVDESALPSASTAEEVKALLHTRLHRSVFEKLKIERLTRVQRLSWGPMLLPDRDVLIRSETGSGKTLAYALPIANTLLNGPPISRDSGTKVIVLTPTRELAEQVSGVVTVLVTFAPFVVVGAIHGGENRHKEKARLRKGVTFLVATPGRLADHLKTTESFNHGGLTTMVLDEADRLLDMGFENAIREIMSIVQPLKRVLVSATITDSVRRLEHFALKSPIKVGETEDVFSVPKSVRQYYTVSQPKLRLPLLLAFLRMQLDAGSRKIVVFVTTSDSAEFHYLLLSRLKNPYVGAGAVRSRKEMAQQRFKASSKKRIQRANAHLTDGDAPEDDHESGGDDDNMVGYGRAGGGGGDFRNALDDGRDAFISANVFKLHGNMTQVDRASVFHTFKTQDAQGVLFCTDVAARGLDMPQIDWIVHYDAPTDERCYIHRVGRTARLGKVGDSLLFFQESEQRFVSYLESFLQTPIEFKKAELYMFYLTKLDPNCNHVYSQAAATLQRGAGLCVRNDTALSRVSLFAYQSFLRAYNGFPRAVKQYFNPQLLHLGHVAASFGIDATPSEVRKRLNADRVVKDERTMSRDTTHFDKGGRLEIADENAYHSTLVSRQMKATKEYHAELKERRRHVPKPHQFTEFDA